MGALPVRLSILCCLQNHLKLEKQAEGGPSGGRLKAIIDTVIGNLQLSITNIHIRYEVGWALIAAVLHQTSICSGMLARGCHQLGCRPCKGL